ncbi:MAG: phage tail length tape measure family protein [Actinomycetota bacterium]|nr:phage tail length tape measure family protein [Actinomycetota bacterium]
MARGSGTVTVKITGEASGLKRAFGDADRAAGGFGSRLGGLGKTIGALGVAAGAVAIGGIAALGAGLYKSVQNAAEGRKIMAETDRVIASMGAGAWTSSEQVAALASRLGRVSAAGDEAVQEVANLLLTFGNVVNKVGEGNDVFDQAVGLSVDLAQVLGTDAKGAALQLGKALNDPIKGITALSRAGVSFTEQQKEQIKTLVASGDVLGAQKIILAELTKQVGGAAEAYGKTFLGSIDRVKNAIGDMSELVGGPMIDALFAPTTSGFADWLERVHDILEPLSKRLTDMFTRLDVGGKIFARLEPLLAAVEGWLRRFVAGFEQVAPEIEAAVERGDWGAVRDTLRRVAQEAVDGAAPNLAGLFRVEGANWEEQKGILGGRIKDVILSALDALAAAGGEIAEKAGRIIGQILVSPALWGGIAKGAWGVLIGAFGDQGAVGVLKIGGILVATVAGAAALVIAGLPGFAVAIGGALIALTANAIIQGTATITEALVGWIANVVQFLFEGAIRLGEAFGRGLITWLPRVVEFFAQVGGAIIEAVARFVQWLFEGAIRAGEAFVQGFRDRWPAIRQWFAELPGAILRNMGSPIGWLVEAGRAVVEGMWNGISGMGGWLWRQVQDFFRRNVIDPARRLFGIASPSKLFADYGQELSRGLAVGMMAQIREVERAALALRDASIPPEQRMGRGLDLTRSVMSLAGGALRGGFAAGGVRPAPIVINVNAGMGADGRDIASHVQRALRDYRRVNGRLAI